MNEQTENLNSLQTTPLAVVAPVSRLVCKVADRLTGDRSEFPLLVAAMASRALSQVGIGSNIFYGQAAWLEIMEDQSPMWVGCWGEHHHIWLATQFGEIVDLTVSVSYRKKAHKNPDHRPKYSPPILWSRDVPRFYRYKPEGIAELELTSERDQRWLKQGSDEVIEKLFDGAPVPTLMGLLSVAPESLDFPDEVILCPDRRILDDAAGSFKHYDRALSVFGIPDADLF